MSSMSNPCRATHGSGTIDAVPTTASFALAIHDTFAIITRRASRLSRGVRELIGLLTAHMQAIAAELDRSR
jgi:hypothetical protein